jgi:hypothetical protein
MKEGLDLSRYEPGILAADLDVMFCGVNPVTIAAVADVSIDWCGDSRCFFRARSLSINR